MDLGLDGKLVLVTGGSKGIGLACRRRFLAEGARVALVSRTRATSTPGRAARRRDRVTTHAADLTDPDAALRVVADVEDAVGPVDVLVTSAGAAKRVPFAELDAGAWHRAMQAKFFSYVHVVDPVVKRMAERGAGTVVNVIGMGGKVAAPTHLAGGAANAALMLATAGWANAYGPSGLRVNAVNPAGTLTERLTEGVKAQARQAGVSEDEAMAQQVGAAPLGRLAEPEEVADAVVWLASARASYVNGAILSMDGATTPLVV